MLRFFREEVKIVNKFQFLYGAIKGPFSRSVISAIRYFNSCMVRLKEVYDMLNRIAISGFQFLYGAIKGTRG
ncbi:hypothetical protein SAMN05421747_1353 [Parapedobacter composti]|uniref:Uncharacterized protein n=1 Tax=Parapedobacter composti TaxID=623281 RepID=A0A1I1MR44_9SPHI|nr:hypothetical protein SAMN05421747_1353 [Parapedobacter composti]